MKTFFFSILMISLSSFVLLNDEPITVTGIISDMSGSPIAGVNVVVKGANRGTISDANGKYTLTVNPTDKTLIFSFIGMETQEIALKGRTVINVVLVENTMSLEEVVVSKREARKSMDCSRAVASVACEAQIAFTVVADNMDFNTENYAGIEENGYKNVSDQPLSTFSIDVDRA